MNNGHLALYYLGIALLVSGCATFLGGLGYLFWLVFSEPTIITHVINPRLKAPALYADIFDGSVSGGQDRDAK